MRGVLLLLVVAWGGGWLGRDSAVVGGALTWGVQSSCAGCVHVVGNVAEWPDHEVMHAECFCPYTSEGGCVCATQFDWWWNLQCAANTTFRLEGGCGKEAQWHVVAGNISGETVLADLTGSCSDPRGCSSPLPANLKHSTRRIEVMITVPECPGLELEQRAYWELPINSEVLCTNVNQFIEQVERNDAGSIVVILACLLMGCCLGCWTCRQKRTFDDKPSAYFSKLEKEAEQEGTEMQ